MSFILLGECYEGPCNGCCAVHGRVWKRSWFLDGHTQTRHTHSIFFQQIAVPPDFGDSDLHKTMFVIQGAIRDPAFHAFASIHAYPGDMHAFCLPYLGVEASVYLIALSCARPLCVLGERALSGQSGQRRWH